MEVSVHTGRIVLPIATSIDLKELLLTVCCCLHDNTQMLTVMPFSGVGVTGDGGGY